MAERSVDRSRQGNRVELVCPAQRKAPRSAGEIELAEEPHVSEASNGLVRLMPSFGRFNAVAFLVRAEKEIDFRFVPSEHLDRNLADLDDRRRVRV